MKMKIVIATLALGLFSIASVHAQEKKDKDEGKKHENMEKTAYSCSMHPEIKSEKPGDCPKCGMKLTKMEMGKDNRKEKAYTCSMHSEVKSDKPGECPKCGMKLVEKKMDLKKEGDPDGHNH
jgi:uncharacterized paraquat-inducible protein A